MDISTTAIELPESFNASQYDSIPYARHNLFEQSSPELEDLGRELIRKSLETRLGKPVVSRDTINQRFGLKKLGYTSDHILSGKVLVR